MNARRTVYRNTIIGIHTHTSVDCNRVMIVKRLKFYFLIIIPTNLFINVRVKTGKTLNTHLTAI